MLWPNPNNVLILLSRSSTICILIRDTINSTQNKSHIFLIKISRNYFEMRWFYKDECDDDDTGDEDTRDDDSRDKDTRDEDTIGEVARDEDIREADFSGLNICSSSKRWQLLGRTTDDNARIVTPEMVRLMFDNCDDKDYVNENDNDWWWCWHSNIKMIIIKSAESDENFEWHFPCNYPQALITKSRLTSVWICAGILLQ